MKEKAPHLLNHFSGPLLLWEACGHFLLTCSHLSAPGHHHHGARSLLHGLTLWTFCGGQGPLLALLFWMLAEPGVTVDSLHCSVGAFPRCRFSLPLTHFCL